MKLGEVLLPSPETAKLKAAHHAKTRREADRIKAVVLLSKGWTAVAVAEALLLNEGTVRSYWARYREEDRGARETATLGGLGYLNETQRQALEAHFREHVYLTVQERFGVA